MLDKICIHILKCFKITHVYCKCVLELEVDLTKKYISTMCRVNEGLRQSNYFFDPLFFWPSLILEQISLQI